MPSAITVPDPDWTRTKRALARLPRLLAEMRAKPSSLPLLAGGRLLPLRRAVRWAANSLAPGAEPGSEPSPAAVHGPSLAQALAALRCDGIATGLTMRSDLATAIRAFAESERPCTGGASRNIVFRPEDQPDAERRHGVALPVGHFAESDLDCPAVAAVAADPWVHALAAAYLGPAARLIEVRLWWSFPSARAGHTDFGIAGQDSFHFDLGDWSQLKFFFQLTEVGPANGPHRFVRGSHRGRRLADQLSPFVARRQAQILGTYGQEAILELTGPAGSGFAEDPFGFHTGAALQDGRRLMLELSFGITGTRRRPRRPPG